MGHLPTRTIRKQMAEIVSAIEARKALDSNLNLELKKEMEKIRVALGNAIAAGKDHFDLKKVTDLAKAKLKEAGYKVEYWDNSDPRDNYSDTFWRVTF